MRWYGAESSAARWAGIVALPSWSKVTGRSGIRPASEPAARWSASDRQAL
jgi:hypothetical protein